MMTSLLEVNDLRTRFHTPEGTVHAVNGISFHVDEGETLAVVGESGCGKSVSMLTTLRLIPIPPGEIVSGSVVFLGQDLLSISETKMERIRGKEISMVFQEPMTSLNPVLTVGRQLTESIRVHMGIDQTEADARAVALLDSVGIAEPHQRLRDYPHQFSGGMRQRVGIAIALACTPSLLIADEPTTALDVTIQAQIVDLVIKLRERLGMSIIWVTHDLGVVAELANRVIVMYAGYIVEQADVYTLYDDPRHPYTQALLAALPRADRRRKGSRLKSIPGAPPNLIALPKGCPFAPRCTFHIERCWSENPALDSINSRHQIACWVDITKGSAI
jgi:oligopeptide transport system ATP-binding protein